MHKIKNNPISEDDAVNKKYVDDNKVDNTIILNNADEVNSFNKGYQSFMVEPSVADEIGLPNSPSSTWFCIHYSHSKGFEFPSQIAFEYAGLERIMYRTCGNGVWHNWRKVCTTSVADVPETVINVSTLSSDEAKEGEIIYIVKNGICHMTITNLKIKNTDQILKMFPDNTIPKCAIRERWYVLTDTTDATNNILVSIRQDGSMGHYKLGNIDKVYSGSFSYPVAES